MLLEGILQEYLFLLNLQLKKKNIHHIDSLSPIYKVAQMQIISAVLTFYILFESHCKLAFTETCTTKC